MRMGVFIPPATNLKDHGNPYDRKELHGFREVEDLVNHRSLEEIEDERNHRAHQKKKGET